MQSAEVRPTPSNGDAVRKSPRTEAAEYINAMLDELSKLASRAELKDLVSIVEMAKLETEQILEGSTTSQL